MWALITSSSAQNFRTLVNAIHDSYVHARYMAEPFPTKNYHQLAENCKTALERLRLLTRIFIALTKVFPNPYSNPAIQKSGKKIS